MEMVDLRWNGEKSLGEEDEDKGKGGVTESTRTMEERRGKCNSYSRL